MRKWVAAPPRAQSMSTSISLSPTHIARNLLSLRPCWGLAVVQGLVNCCLSLGSLSQWGLSGRGWSDRAQFGVLVLYEDGRSELTTPPGHLLRDSEEVGFRS